jgi:hypothetical protein
LAENSLFHYVPSFEKDSASFTKRQYPRSIQVVLEKRKLLSMTSEVKEKISGRVFRRENVRHRRDDLPVREWLHLQEKSLNAKILECNVQRGA